MPPQKKSRFRNISTPSPYREARSIDVAGEQWVHVADDGHGRHTYAHGDRTTARTVLGSYS